MSPVADGETGDMQEGRELVQELGGMQSMGSLSRA